MFRSHLRNDGGPGVQPLSTLYNQKWLRSVNDMLLHITAVLWYGAVNKCYNAV